jgi:hypothetical protein
MSARNGRYKICTICGKKYYIRADRAEASKYCSHKCWSNRRTLRKCEYCGNDITSYFGLKYCSRKCSHSAMVGEKAARWIDGKSLERDRARDGTRLKEWRRLVFKRDGFKCVLCEKGKELHAHHIIEWAKDESKRFDVDNGMTLCIDCHEKMHRKNFHKKNKICVDCGKKVKVENTRCHPCASKNYWRMQKLDPGIKITKEHTEYQLK